MITLGLDVGATVGLALASGGIPTWATSVKGCDTADGRALLLALLKGLARPDRIVIERPTRNPKSKIDAYASLCERAGEAVALCEVVFPYIPILRPFPLDRNGTKGWQDIKAGDMGEDAKDRSRACVARLLRGREDAGSRRVLEVVRASHDAADACCLAVWGGNL